MIYIFVHKPTAMKSLLLLANLFIFIFAHAQNVGIGTANPQAKLHVADSSVVFSASGVALAAPGNPPLSGTGRRMMWYADKGAFRVGFAAGTSWDKANVGNYSFAAGYGSIASGNNAIALGLNNNAPGASSLALGFNANATSDYGVAIGTVSSSTGIGSASLGYFTNASGRYSSAIGYNGISKALGGTVVGLLNDIADTPDPNDTASTDRIFQVGNGYFDANDEEARSNALTVLRNGNTGIGTTTPAPSALLEISSTSKGFLPPRMNTSQRNAITSPATGLTIYNTSSNAYEVYNGSAWYSTVHYIGESYGGGIVFYVYDNGQHGLIAAPADQNAGLGIRWFCCVASSTYAKANGVGAGLKNTCLITAAQAQLSGALANAASACNEYSPTVGGVTYGDWYLPSRHELNLLYLQKAVVGGFANSPYWSSSEFSDTDSWLQNFGNGSSTVANRTSNFLVRSVRAF